MRTRLQNSPVRPVSLVFVALVLLTGFSWWSAEGGGRTHHEGLANIWLTMLVMTIAAVKVHLVGMHFMELRHAPLVLKLTFHAWIVMVWGLIIGLQLVSG